jgi:cytochrome b subunit of formate dehydrogenase
LVGVSGVVLVVEKWFLIRLLDDYWRGIFSIIHIIGAFLFIAFLPIHFLMAIVPINWPTLKSQFLFRGYVPVSWWRFHHPAYVEKIEGAGGGSDE